MEEFKQYEVNNNDPSMHQSRLCKYGNDKCFAYKKGQCKYRHEPTNSPKNEEIKQNRMDPFARGNMIKNKNIAAPLDP